jgi:transposase
VFVFAGDTFNHKGGTKAGRAAGTCTTLSTGEPGWVWRRPRNQVLSWREETLQSMPRPKKYSDELRERAVRLVFESGRPIAHVARDLGIHKEALRLWVRQAEADAGSRNDRLTTEERERLKVLERENRELRKANEILKAASVFFAKELDGTPRK